MLKISPISVTQLLIDVPNNEFGESDCVEDKTRIVSASTISKKSTRVGYLTCGSKKGDKVIKKCKKGAKSFKYLTLDIKKTFNLMWHVFT